MKYGINVFNEFRCLQYDSDYLQLYVPCTPIGSQMISASCVVALKNILTQSVQLKKAEICYDVLKHFSFYSSCVSLYIKFVCVRVFCFLVFLHFTRINVFTSERLV